MSSTRSPRFFTRTIERATLALVLGLGIVARLSEPVTAAGLIVEVEPVGSGLQFHASSQFAVDWEIQVSLGTIQTSPSPPHFPTGGTLPPRIKRFSSQGT